MYRLPGNFEHPVVGLVETLLEETVVHDQGSQLSLEKSVTPIEFLDHYESILYCLQRSRLKIIENEKVLFHAVGIHLLEDDPDDVFLVAKMVIKIAWANAGGSGDMVGRDGLGALLVCRTFLNSIER
ncbi:MAG: hypothetical protein Q8R88_16565 [Desulfoprunum sp.]|nr:hypothetical protein [Desulfoprunum sp.]